MSGDPGENRHSDRSTVMLTAEVEQDGCPVVVKVSNVSAKGALVIGTSLPVPGSAVVFRRNELAIASRIAWIDGDHAGIEFDDAMPLEELLRHVRPLRIVEPARYRRPGLKGDT